MYLVGICFNDRTSYRSPEGVGVSMGVIALGLVRGVAVFQMMRHSDNWGQIGGLTLAFFFIAAVTGIAAAIKTPWQLAGWVPFSLVGGRTLLPWEMSGRSAWPRSWASPRLDSSCWYCSLAT
jgi:hypothetical protein